MSLSQNIIFFSTQRSRDAEFAKKKCLNFNPLANSAALRDIEVIVLRQSLARRGNVIFFKAQASLSGYSAIWSLVLKQTLKKDGQS